jgi:hypothetical protein
MVTPCSIADRSRNTATEKPTPDSYKLKGPLMNTSSEDSNIIRDANADMSEASSSQTSTGNTARLTGAQEIKADQDFYMHSMLKAQQKAHLDALLEAKEQVILYLRYSMKRSAMICY